MSDDHQQFFPFGETTAVDLARDFSALLAGFGGDAKACAATASAIVARYSETHRFYHNLSHVAALLAGVERERGHFSDERGVRLAVWFHDAVYDPRSASNEADSAELAVESLRAVDAAPATIERVAQMILATARHDAAGLDEDGRLFLDLDLGILGAPEEIYERYAAAIRAEYAFVPEDVYRRERARVMRTFLEREFIYFSPVARARWEEAARRNVANEIKKLS